jgi:hypothetical protein
MRMAGGLSPPSTSARCPIGSSRSTVSEYDSRCKPASNRLKLWTGVLGVYDDERVFHKDGHAGPRGEGPVAEAGDGVVPVCVTAPLRPLTTGLKANASRSLFRHHHCPEATRRPIAAQRLSRLGPNGGGGLSRLRGGSNRGCDMGSTEQPTGVSA